MKLGDIDLKLKPVKEKLFLCKPNKQTIGKLNEAFDTQLTLKLGALNEISFRIPTQYEKHHELTSNDNVNTIKGRYLIRLEMGGFKDYFIINEKEKVFDDNESVRFHGYSLGYQLNNKIIRTYKETSVNCSKALRDALSYTNWRVGYIDADFDLKYRSFDISKKTILESINEIGKTFDALIIWDSVNRQVNMYKPENIGNNKGLKIKYGKYLKSMNEENNFEATVTRLHLYGKDNMSIRRLNPTGTTYIQDFSYYIYPFERDSNKNVLKHSDYMSDGLCNAILDYDELLQTKQGEFELLLDEKSLLLSSLSDRQIELATLNSELNQIWDELDLANTNNEDTTDIVTRKDNKTLEVEAKEDEIIQIESDISVVDTDIETLSDIVKTENNFTSDQLFELNDYIIESEYSNDNIANDKDLLKEGKKAFEKERIPSLKLSLNIINFLNVIEEQRNWGKLNIGDTITILHERLKVDVKAKIIEATFNFDDKDVSITIANEKGLDSDKEQFLDMLYESYSASTKVNMDKFKWDLADENKGSINKIINNIWNANKQAIESGKNQVVTMNDRGLKIIDPNDPLTYLVGLNSRIAITNDGGNTWKHAITPEGIVGERLYGKIIMGENLTIEDEDGIITLTGSKGTVFDRNGDKVMWFGLIEENPDKFGLKLENSINQVIMDRDDGFQITKKNGLDWEKIFWTNPLDGIIYTKGVVAEGIKIVDNLGEEIINAETRNFNIGKFQTIVTDGKLTPLEKLRVKKEWETIKANYPIIKMQGDNYANPTKNSKNVDSFSSNIENTITSDIIDTTNLTNYYNELKNYIEPFLVDMDLSEIVDRSVFVLKFKNYYDEANRILRKVEDALKYSSLQLGTYYNDVVIDQNIGFLAMRSDNMVRTWLNATKGIAIQKFDGTRWVDKFYADTEGTLVVEDLFAKNITMDGVNLKTELEDLSQVKIGESVALSLEVDNRLLEIKSFDASSGTTKVPAIRFEDFNLSPSSEGWIYLDDYYMTMYGYKYTYLDSEVSYVKNELVAGGQNKDSNYSNIGVDEDTSGNILPYLMLSRGDSSSSQMKAVFSLYKDRTLIHDYNSSMFEIKSWHGKISLGTDEANDKVEIVSGRNTSDTTGTMFYANKKSISDSTRPYLSIYNDYNGSGAYGSSILFGTTSSSDVNTNFGSITGAYNPFGRSESYIITNDFDHIWLKSNKGLRIWSNNYSIGENSSGELVLKHSSGSYIKIGNDIEIKSSGNLYLN